MSDSNTNAPEDDPEQLVRLLDLELMRKRAGWKEAGARHRNIRITAFLFLFLLVAACLFAFFFSSSKVSEERATHPPPASTADAPPR